MDDIVFTATRASRGYHVCKATSWINAKVGDKVTVELKTTASSLQTNLYARAIRMKNKYFSNLITVLVSRHVHFFITTESGKVHGYVKSLTYRP